MSITHITSIGIAHIVRAHQHALNKLLTIANTDVPISAKEQRLNTII